MRCRQLVALCFVTTLSLPALAQSTPPPPGKPAPFEVPATQTFTLENGLAVTLIPYGSIPKTTVRLYTRVGNVHDTRGGLADVAYNLISEDGSHPKTQHSADKAAAMGGEVTTSVTEAYSTVEISVLSEHTTKALDLMSDLLAHYSPTQDTLTRVSETFARNMSIRATSPNGQASQAFGKAMFGDHPYAMPIPSQDDIMAITLEDVNGLIKQHVTANNSHLYISGVFDTSATQQAVMDAFAWMQSGTKNTFSTPAVAQPSQHFVERPDAPQSELRLGLQVPGPEHKDFVALDVMNTLLGGSFSSRITSNIREDKGYTYSPRSSLRVLPNAAYWAQGAAVTAEHTADSLSEIRKEIALLQADGVSDEELRGFKNYMSGLFVLRNSSRGGVISQLWYQELHNLPDDRLSKLMGMIDAVQPADVKRVANQYLPLDNMIRVVVGDPATVPAQLEALDSGE
ncbi:insulinase family protein [Aestuariibacter halophilus]|uniref:Insulinase family protein n=1 Tax=Fluctibacter halophilus TaxID=226011 RepID=A0ABS8GCP1_9ALTE|nr:pitrilysin family protein [Aestuariibacter halophilus]MCC2618344.1 insulinase family protein [Aestuariibacter halophilus]